MAKATNEFSVPCKVGYPDNFCEGHKMTGSAIWDTNAEGTNRVTITLTTFPNEDKDIQKSFATSKDGGLFVINPNKEGLIGDVFGA